MLIVQVVITAGQNEHSPHSEGFVAKMNECWNALFNLIMENSLDKLIF